MDNLEWPSFPEFEDGCEMSHEQISDLFRDFIKDSSGIRLTIFKKAIETVKEMADDLFNKQKKYMDNIDFLLGEIENERILRKR